MHQAIVLLPLLGAILAGAIALWGARVRFPGAEPAAGVLYLVGTPIGNRGDLSPRAQQVLAGVDRIACEDTRQTRKLLDHFDIKTGALSYHDHNEASRTTELIQRLESGSNVALVSDAGTPLLSDPGYRLVHAAVADVIGPAVAADDPVIARLPR